MYGILVNRSDGIKYVRDWEAVCTICLSKKERKKSHSFSLLLLLLSFELGIRIIIKEEKKTGEQGDSTKATHTSIAFGQSLQRRDKERKTNTYTRAREQRRFCSNKKKTLESKREEKKRRRRRRRREPHFAVDYL